MRFRDKTVLVTGASSGIGKDLAWEFLRAGARCAIASRNITRLESLAADWQRQDAHVQGRILPLRLDVTDPVSCHDAVTVVARHWGGIDVLVNNAGYGLMGPAAKTPVEEGAKIFETNFFGACRMTMEALPYLRRARPGMLVMMSSIAGLNPVPWMAYYCATKAALNIWTDALAMEEANGGLKVCSIMPGPVKSDFGDNSRYFGIPRLPRVRYPLDSPQAAALIIKALCSEKRHYVVGYSASALVGVQRALGPVSRGVLSKLAGSWDRPAS
ncbi:MAG: SDR family oxidoreductase [Elusimicrobiota bacterium]